MSRWSKIFFITILVFLILAGWKIMLYASGFPLEHDGLYLRLQLGFAATEIEGRGYTSVPDFKASGTGTIFRFDIGGVISENLILFGTIGGITLDDPEVRIGDTSDTLSNSTFRVSDLGVGVTYYFMPANIYMSGSFNLAKDKSEISSEGTMGSSDNGFGIHASIGKEWWISDNWGIGLGGFGYLGFVPDPNEGPVQGDGVIRNMAVGLFLSATYN